MKNARSVAIALLALLATGAAQETKLQVLDAQEGVVVVRGLSKIGEIWGGGCVVIIQSVEMLSAATNQREYGITVDVQVVDERPDRSFVDYEEIDSLIKGIDDVGKIKRSITKLDEFHAEYRTKGRLGVSAFSKGEEILCSISSGGSIHRVNAVLEVDALRKLKDLLRAAKLKLDAVRGP